MFGDRLKELRQQRQLTQNEFASILGIGRTTLSHYELNNREPDFEILEKIANYFDVSIDYLVGRSNLKNYDEHVFHSDFQYLSKKLESSNPEIRKIVVDIIDKVFLSIHTPLYRENLELLTKLFNIYDCIFQLNSSLSSNSRDVELNTTLSINAVETLTFKNKLKVLSTSKNDLNILLDDLFEYYLNKEKPTK